MKNKEKYIIGILTFVLVIVVAVILYGNLSEHYKPTENVPETSETGNNSLAPAPDFTVVSDSGEDVKLSDMKGKPTIINFWATWCGPCKMELPHFDKFHGEYKDKINFMMVNVDDAPESEIRSFVQEGGFKFPLYFDSYREGSANYNLYSIPLTVFVDAEGNLIAQRKGAMDENTLKMYIDKLI